MSDMKARCRCGHVGASHLQVNPDQLGTAACQPRRGRHRCRCAGWDPEPVSPPCPLGHPSHSWCSCVPGQLDLLDVVAP